MVGCGVLVLGKVWPLGICKVCARSVEGRSSFLSMRGPCFSTDGVESHSGERASFTAQRFGGKEKLKSALL